MRPDLLPLVARAALAAAPVVPQFAPLLPTRRYLPTEAGLRARFLGMARPDRQAELDHYLTQVSARWAAASAAGVVALLSPIRRVERDARAALPATPAGLPVSPSAVVPAHLRQDLALDAATGPALGRELVAGRITTVQAARHPRTCAQAVVGLRRLDDVLCRMLTAQRCAAATGAELALVLALYRTEGALAMPPSTASIDAGVPSGTTDAATSLVPRPDISHLVWLANVHALASVHVARRYGTAAFILQVAGLDLFFQPGFSFQPWSRQVWHTATGVDDAAGAVLREVGLSSGVVVVPRSPAPPAPSGAEAYRGTVTDPVGYVALVLGEGVQLLRSLQDPADLLGAGPPLRPDAPARLGEGLAYLRYNVGDDQARLLLASALRAAAGTRGPRWAALRALIATQPSLPSDVRAAQALASTLAAGVTGADLKQRRAHVSAATVWPVMRSWCAAPGHLDSLTDFVERASWTEWSTGWAMPRANVARYRVLLAFYRRLTGP